MVKLLNNILNEYDVYVKVDSATNEECIRVKAECYDSAEIMVAEMFNVNTFEYIDAQLVLIE